MGTQITENSVHSVINAKHIARKINFCNLLEPYLRSLKTYFYTRKQTHAPLNNAACISGLGEAVYQTPVTKQRRLGVLGTRALWSLGPGGWTSGMQAWAGPAPPWACGHVPSPCPLPVSPHAPPSGLVCALVASSSQDTVLRGQSRPGDLILPSPPPATF